MPLPLIDYTVLTDEEVAQLKAEAGLEQDRRLRIAQAPIKAEAVALEYLQDVGRVDGSDWVQPTGAHDAYPLGYKVNKDNITWASLISANTTVPGSDPRWWKDLTTVIDPNAWNPNYKNYLVGDTVNYEDKTYSCLQAHVSQPDWTPAAVPALWQDTSILPDPEPDPEPPTVAAWDANGVLYLVDTQVTYNDVIYICLQEHTSQPDLMPDTSLDLWQDTTIVPDPGPTVAAWDANGVLYLVDTPVTYNDVIYICLQEHTSQEGWTPAAVPALWQQE